MYIKNILYAQIRHVIGTNLLSETWSQGLQDQGLPGPSNSSGTFSGFEATA